MRADLLRILAVLGVLSQTARRARVYLDPGTGSMLLSAVISLLVTSGLALQAYGYRVLGWIGRLVGRPRAEPGDPEPQATRDPSGGPAGEESR